MCVSKDIHVLGAKKMDDDDNDDDDAYLFNDYYVRVLPQVRAPT